MSTNSQLERLLAEVMGPLNPFTAFLDDTGAELRRLREISGVSQRTLADRMHTTQNQVWQLESRPGVSMQLRSVWAYADALGYDTFVVFHPREVTS